MNTSVVTRLKCKVEFTTSKVLNYYYSINQVLKISIKYQSNNIQKRLYDHHYVEPRFHVKDLVIYEVFKYTNTRKLESTFNRYFILNNKLLYVNCAIDRPNYHTSCLNNFDTLT